MLVVGRAGVQCGDDGNRQFVEQADAAEVEWEVEYVDSVWELHRKGCVGRYGEGRC